MKRPRPEQSHPSSAGARRRTKSHPSREPATSDVLILSDGMILAHNMTQAMAAVLHEVNPQDPGMRARAAAAERTRR